MLGFVNALAILIFGTSATIGQQKSRNVRHGRWHDCLDVSSRLRITKAIPPALLLR